MKRYAIRAISPLILRRPNQSKSPNGFQRIYHNHIRKCAGTSINKTMIEALGGDGNTYERLAKSNFHKIDLGNRSVVGWNTYAINRGSFFYAFSHEPLHKLKIERSTFTFCFLRDPVERVVSHYNMLKDMIAEGGTHVALKAEKNFAFGDFDHYIENIPRNHLEAQLFNFSGDYDVEEGLSNLRQRVNYVGDVRSVQKELVPFLTSEFGFRIAYRHLRSSKSNFQPSQDQLCRLREMLSVEREFKKSAEEFYGFNLRS